LPSSIAAPASSASTRRSRGWTAWRRPTPWAAPFLPSIAPALDELVARVLQDGVAVDGEEISATSPAGDPAHERHWAGRRR
jgi:hypothetical protein